MFFFFIRHDQRDRTNYRMNEAISFPAPARTSSHSLPTRALDPFKMKDDAQKRGTKRKRFESLKQVCLVSAFPVYLLTISPRKI